MKWLLLIVVAIVLVILIVIGGGLGFLLNVKTDVNDPDFAARFQQQMTQVCLQRTKSAIGFSGQSLDYQQEALVKQVCDCNTKAMLKIVARKGAKTPVEIQKAISDSEQEMNAALNSCLQAYGVQ